MSGRQKNKREIILFSIAANSDGSYTIGNNLLKCFDYDIDLCFLLTYLIKTDGFFGNNAFFNQREQIKKCTGFSPAKQLRITNKLIKMRLISIEKRGVPAKNYYTIHYKKIKEMILKRANPPKKREKCK